MKKQKLDDLIQEFVLKQSGAFLFEELAEYAAATVKKFDDDAEDLLWVLACRSNVLFADDRVVYSDRLMPRHVFFKGAEFRVTPLEGEVADGYLVPGHRFCPFLSIERFPGEAVLKLPDGSTVPTRSVQLPAAELDRFLLYFGRYGAIEYLLYDDEGNAESLRPPFEGPISVTVFDFKSFYSQCGFKAGDSLMLTVEDWLKGVFSVRHVPAEQGAVDFSEAHRWTHALRLAFEEACQTSELDHDCNEQMARMLWCAHCNKDASPVLSNPPLSLAAFFNLQKDLTVQAMGQISFFWPTDEPIESRMLNSMSDPVGTVPETELDACFSLLGLSLSSDEAEAYMRDALSHGVNQPEVVLARVIQGRTLHFPTAEAQTEFKRLWRERWDEVRKAHDPRNDPHREMRSVFLDLNDQCLAVLRRLDQHSSDLRAVLSKPETLQLGELSSLISSVLLMCNKPGGNPGEFSLPLDEMAHDLSAVIRELSGGLEADGAKASRNTDDGPVYQLKISLNYASPPIWRRVLVPADIELEDLHEVIQAVFGWTNSHLHQYIDGETFYQPDSEDDGFMGLCNEDSFGVALNALLRKAKDKLVYEYDFGDSWKHQVLLEKILPAGSAESLPVCMAGKRACPPEDCGGIPGYFHMLETLSGPDGDEKADMLDWVGGSFDPEAFDLDKINARLRAWYC